MSIPLVLVIVGIGVLVWAGLRYATPRATPIAPDDPLWVSAVERARATLGEMRELHQAGRQVWVKFPLQGAPGATEHVWGSVTSMHDDRLRCRIETPPVAGASAASLGEMEILFAEIEDWQVELADGTIRGGFTTRAQAQIAKRRGEPIPPHVEDMIRRMTE